MQRTVQRTPTAKAREPHDKAVSAPISPRSTEPKVRGSNPLGLAEAEAAVERPFISEPLEEPQGSCWADSQRSPRAALAK
jgi:hypothetical protein